MNFSLKSQSAFNRHVFFIEEFPRANAVLGNLCTPFFFLIIEANPLDARFVGAAKSQIFIILRGVTFAKIYQPIVETVPVDVINYRMRPSAKYIKPHEPVSQITTPFQRDKPVFNASWPLVHVAGLVSGFCLSSASYLICKLAGFWGIDNQFQKPLLIN